MKYFKFKDDIMLLMRCQNCYVKKKKKIFLEFNLFIIIMSNIFKN
jgi:hypothetical protein